MAYILTLGKNNNTKQQKKRILTHFFALKRCFFFKKFCVLINFYNFDFQLTSTLTVDIL